MLDSVVQKLFKAGLASSTSKVYKTGANRYCSFCNLYGIHKPFPVCEEVLLCFAAYLFKEGLKAGTIKNYLVAIRHTQLALGFGYPHIMSMLQLEYVI